MNDNNPHDHFFKSTFSRQDIAQDYLKTILPSAILQKLDLSKLTLESGSFIDEKLDEYFSDILYTCPYGENNSINIAFLLEHKSTPPSFPHLQLLRYQLERWTQQLQQKKSLTPIIPIIFYHGKRKWIKKPFNSYFKGYDENIAAFLPNFDYILTDMTQWEDEEILNLKVGFLINALMLFKHAKEDHYILKHPEKIFTGLDKTEKNKGESDFLLTLFVYLVKTTQFSRENWNKIIHEIPSPLKITAMSTYDMIIEQGIEQGLEQGIEQGLEQGKELGFEIAIRVIQMHKKGMLAKDIAQILNIDTKSIELVIAQING